MRRAYRAIMDRVQLRDEARARIAQHLQLTLQNPAPRAPWPRRQFVALAASLLLFLAGAWFYARSRDTGQQDTLSASPPVPIQTQAAAPEHSVLPESPSNAPTPTPDTTPDYTPAPAYTPAPVPENTPVYTPFPDVPIYIPEPVPADTPIETPAPVPADTQINTPAPVPEDTPTETPAPVPTDVPIDTPAPVPAETPAPVPEETPVPTPDDMLPGLTGPADLPEETPGDTECFPAIPEPIPDPEMELPPFVQPWDSAEALSEAVGYPVPAFTDVPFAVQKIAYYDYGDLAEVLYTGAHEELCFRKSPGQEDNSGDYTVYLTERTVTVHGYTVTLRGTGDTVSLALWQDEDFSYSLSSKPALPVEDMLALIEQIYTD